MSEGGAATEATYLLVDSGDVLCEAQDIDQDPRASDNEVQNGSTCGPPSPEELGFAAQRQEDVVRKDGCDRDMSMPQPGTAI